MKEWTQIGAYQIRYNEEIYDIEVEGTFSESIEGQDADGNRGILMSFYDDIKILGISPLPPSKECLDYIESCIYSLQPDDILWDTEGLERVKHIIQEGSTSHVLSWDSKGPHCSEPNCEINEGKD